MLFQKLKNIVMLTKCMIFIVQLLKKNKNKIMIDYFSKYCFEELKNNIFRKEKKIYIAYRVARRVVYRHQARS